VQSSDRSVNEKEQGQKEEYDIERRGCKMTIILKDHFRKEIFVVFKSKQGLL